jgi:DNA-binding transcriptional LysR family regulator
MDLTWLEDFLALAETLNFSKAAATRSVTQPAFSRRIRALENGVGTALFHRTTHQVSLTPAGEHFRSEAGNLVRGLQQLRRETAEASRRHVSRLSFAATHALSFTFFPRWIRNEDTGFATESVTLSSGTMEACGQMMLHGDVQFLLCHDHPASQSRLARPGFSSVVVGDDVLIPLSAPLPSGLPKWSLENQAEARYLAYSDRSALGRIVADWITRCDDAPPLVQVFTSDLATTLMSMACGGDGLVWLPKMLAGDQIDRSRLVVAGSNRFFIPVHIRLYRSTSRLSPMAEAVWSRLKKLETDGTPHQAASSA